MRATRLLVAGIVLGIVLASTLTVGAENKAFLYELEPRSQALPVAVNATGAVVVGNFNGGGGFYWMPTTGVIATGGLSGLAVSADGRTIVGTALDARGIYNAAIWQRAAEWRVLGGFPDGAACDQGLSQATGVSRDGKVIVGYAQRGCTSAHAFKWDDSGGIVDLGSTVAGRSSQAHAVSGDGKIVVGHQILADGFSVGVRWVDGRQEAFSGPRGNVGNADGVNWDGSVIVGRQCRPPTFQNPIEDQTAWMWTARDGLKCLEVPALRLAPIPILGYANAVSDSGRIVGGGQKGGQVDSEALIWIDGKPSYLKDYLRSHGVPDAFDRWINTGEITSISPDGRILVGWGAAIGGFRGYLVILDRLDPAP
jgi:probable HAF family extracellular repeat protein